MVFSKRYVEAVKSVDEWKGRCATLENVLRSVEMYAGCTLATWTMSKGTSTVESAGATLVSGIVDRFGAGTEAVTIDVIYMGAAGVTRGWCGIYRC